MEIDRNDKQSNSFIFQLAYTQINHHHSYPTINICLLILHYMLLLCKFEDFISPSVIISISLPYLTIFIILVVLLAVFILLTIISFQFLILNTLWLYFLIFLQSIAILYIQLTVRCFASDNWCKSDPKLQISVIVVLIILTFIVFIKANCYYPFYQSENYLAMKNGRVTFYLFFYTLLLSLVNHTFNTIDQAKQLGFLLTAALYALTSTPSAASPMICRIQVVLTVGLMWTSGLIWFTPLFQSILINGQQSSTAFWYYWGYSMPIVLGLSFVQQGYLNKGYDWQSLFVENKLQNLRDIYLQCNSLIKIMQKVKKSELRANSVQFKQLWQLIATHNSKCQTPECPLGVISHLRIERGDQLMEQKRFNKTVQKILQFGLQKLSTKKDQFPNLIQLNLQLAHYELEVFHLRTKGLQLFNREFNKEERSTQQLWGLFYLKKKIQGFEGTGQMRASGQSEEEINAFKHDIEVSVTMLAEFWYFLSDPKCNLKKLYDLANVLFPLKIGVDQSWKNVHMMKNIECYYLYARYLVKMFNDKEKGLKILEQARKIEAESHEKEQVLAGAQGNLSEQHGVIFLQFDGKNSGIMYQVNTACQKIFGYNKGQLQGRKVNDIMPRVIAIHHDRILQNYQQTNRPRMMNKERTVWGRSKDGYLFPFTICIKPVRNYFSQTSQVYASVKRDLWVRESAFFFTDVQFNLIDVSASLLGMFPDLYGRTHLKKKMNVKQIIPDFDTFKDSMLAHKQIHQLTINRSYTIFQDQTFTESLLITMQGEEVNIAISGVIGYYFKITKGTGLSSNVQSNTNSQQYSNRSNKQQNAEASNSYWMKRSTDFKFIASVQDKQEEENMKSMVYHGGLVKQNNQTRTLICSRIQSSFERTKMQANSDIEGNQKRDYGKQIKTKRLQSNAIRQIHELSEHQQLNGAAGADEHQQEQMCQPIKPSQLNSILQRQTSNKNISFLKGFTVIILALSTTLCVLQYSSTVSHNSNVMSQISVLTALSAVSSHVMYINMFSCKYLLNLTSTADLDLFKTEINQLDGYTSSIPLSISTVISYSDGSNQEMLLSFAVNKLISEAQILASSQTISSLSNLYFVLYNSVNGIDTGTETSFSQQSNQLLSSNDQVINTYSIYLGVGSAAFALFLIIKNIIIRAVLKKKGQILNIFFQIPRTTCSTIQKQCQRFIQKLSADDNQEQLQMQALQSDDEQAATKKNSRQKKRTIMGQQKTAYNFVIVSLLLLGFLMIYPTIVLSISKSQKDIEQFSLQSINTMVQMQKQLAKVMSYLNTRIVNSNYSLQGKASAAAVDSQYSNFLSLLRKVQEKFYFIGNVLDSAYIKDYNSIFHQNLCESTSCQTEYGQNKGLNIILFYYYDYIIGKYQAQTSANSSSTQLINSAIFDKQNTLRLLIKKYWRRYDAILTSGIERYIKRNDSILFAVMLTICIFNMTILLWGWIRFYVSLQQKILATQYILTFIPIDQINKNPKIVRYIKDHVLRAH